MFSLDNFLLLMRLHIPYRSSMDMLHVHRTVIIFNSTKPTHARHPGTQTYPLHILDIYQSTPARKHGNGSIFPGTMYL